MRRSFIKGANLSLPLNFVNDGEINPLYSGPEIEIIYEDDTFLVMNKPANLFVHPHVYDEQNNCLSFLRSHGKNILDVNRDNYDRGLLYRLDFETSGVLVYLKNNSAYTLLRENFKSLAKKKTYRCLVEGECKLSGDFVHYFFSKELKGKRVVVSNDSSQGEAGSFSIKSLNYQSDTNTTLIEVDLKTGLRHQIRSQMAFLGYPLRGDTFYGGKPALRLYLHALDYQLEYQGKVYSFRKDPIDFNGL